MTSASFRASQERSRATAGRIAGTAGLACAGWLLLSPAMAQPVEAPQVWRDPETGCAYFLGRQGGIAPRYLRDGTPDCPDARAGSRLMDDAARGLAEGLDTLKREVERLRQRFQSPNRNEQEL
ncbi:MAG TPA: hypothetical protein VEZ16_11680 [Microvirga sp.]|nr:hypothetical protein [Microvirga sp.]